MMMDGREAGSTAMPSHHSNNTSSSSSSSSSSTSSSLRFLGLLKQPDLDSLKAHSQTQHNDPLELELELDESDVVWSSSSSFSDSTSRSPPPPLSTTSPSQLHHQHHHLLHHHQTRFNQSKSGLSAALSDDHHPFVRRKSTLNPSLSATSAARTIPPVNSGTYSNGGVKFHQSAPVNVPAWPKNVGDFNKNRNCSNLDKFDEVEDELEDEEEMVPPHVIVARSHVTFSVFEGVGRTLKGRDLRRVRNAVFQKTGFID